MAMSKVAKESAPAEYLPSLVRARDLAGRGIGRGRLPGMLRRGELDRVSRGLYRVQGEPISELETVAAVSKRIPGAIVCLLSALAIHDIGTQLPRYVWIALDRKARKPKVTDLPLRIVRFSGPLLHYGIETRDVLGVHVKLTNPARTVVDCFRYRNKVGMDVALEALRDVIGSRKATIAEIERAADIGRVRTVIGPYLESVVA